MEIYRRFGETDCCHFQRRYRALRNCTKNLPGYTASYITTSGLFVSP